MSECPEAEGPSLYPDADADAYTHADPHANRPDRTAQADYTTSQGFAPSAAAIIEKVRAPRSRSKTTPSAEHGRRVVPLTSGAIRFAEVAAIPPGAVTIVSGPTLLG